MMDLKELQQIQNRYDANDEIARDADLLRCINELQVLIPAYQALVKVYEDGFVKDTKDS